VSSLQPECGPSAPCPKPSKPSKKQRPCRRLRARYHRLVEATASQIEGDPAIFNMDDLEQNLPAVVKHNLWLKQKFMKMMDNVKRNSLAEQPQLAHVPPSVEILDGADKAFAEHSACKEEPPKGFVEPMDIVMHHWDCTEQRLVVGTDKGHAPLEICLGECYDMQTTTFMIPRAQDVSMPMKLLRRKLTTNLGT